MAIHQRNRAWYPEKITVLSDVLNRRGEPSSVTQLFFSLRLGADGRLNTELTRSLKNGEDTTARMKEKVRIRDPRQGEDADDQDYYSVSISDSPFDPERQAAVSYSASGEKHLLFGRHCQRFDFTYQTTIVRNGEKEKLTWSGMAWLEEGSGVPVKLEFSLAPLPAAHPQPVDHLPVREGAPRQVAADPGDHLRPGRLPVHQEALPHHHRAERLPAFARRGGAATDAMGIEAGQGIVLQESEISLRIRARLRPRRPERQQGGHGGQAVFRPSTAPRPCPRRSSAACAPWPAGGSTARASWPSTPGASAPRKPTAATPWSACSP